MSVSLRSTWTLIKGKDVFPKVQKEEYTHSLPPV